MTHITFLFDSSDLEKPPLTFWCISPILCVNVLEEPGSWLETYVWFSQAWLEKPTKCLPGRPYRACCPVHTRCGTPPVHRSLWRKLLSRPLAPWAVMPFTFTFLAPVSSFLGLCIEGFGQSPQGGGKTLKTLPASESVPSTFPLLVLASLPHPRVHGAAEPLSQGSHNREMTSHLCWSTWPSSCVPLDLENETGGMVCSLVLASCLYYHSKWLKASLYFHLGSLLL